VFTWVHLSEPNEPYEQRGESFGSRDIDRYDSEIADADVTISLLVKAVRERRPKTLVIITSDHGEEFGEHGGRYHGTSVYEEQVHVPLVLNAPELLAPRRIKGTVATIDLMPTSLAAVGAPLPLRVRGRDLGSVIAGTSTEPFAPAHAETDEMSLFAEGQLRLVCLRRVGACSLYDLDQDPRQRRDIAASRPRELSTLRGKMRALEGLLAKREREGRENTPDALPEPLRRALAGDADAAIDIGALLSDKEVTIRRKAATALFELGSKDATPALRAALTQEQDPEAKAYIALALVRLGEGAPYVFELYDGPDLGLRRLAALALAESGDFRGQNVLLAWWRVAFPESGPAPPENAMSYARARQVLSAFALRKSKDSVGFLMIGLRDEKLRPHVARALAKIGEDAARPAIAEWLYTEPHLNTRIAMIGALLELGGGPELRDPLVSFLGMPEPIPNGVEAAIRGDILEHVGGPARDAERNRLRRFAQSGVLVDFIVPDLTKGAVAPKEGPRIRVLCRAESSSAGEIRVGARGDVPKSSEKKAPIPANRPQLDGSRSAVLKVPEGEGPVEVFADLPDEAGARPGKQASLVFFATQGVRIEACVLVPRRTDPPREKN
jgi:HEAT repeat protein